MASIASERSKVIAKALFEEGLTKAQAEVVKRLGEEVEQGLDERRDGYENTVPFYCSSRLASVSFTTNCLTISARP